VLTALQYTLMFVAYVALQWAEDVPYTSRGRGLLVAGLVLTLPVVNAGNLTLQNGLALLFPAWVRVGPSRGAGGVEAMGQNMLTMIFGTVGLGALLIAPGAAAIGTFLVLHGRMGVGAYAVALVVCLFGLLAEIGFLLRWLGGVFERTDPASTGEA
jgi:hypothetical protein